MKSREERAGELVNKLRQLFFSRARKRSLLAGLANRIVAERSAYLKQWKGRYLYADIAEPAYTKRASVFRELAFFS